MASTRDPARYGMATASAGLNLVVGALLAVQLFEGEFVLGIIGAVDALISVPLLVFAIRRFRRERARTD